MKLIKRKTLTVDVIRRRRIELRVGIEVKDFHRMETNLYPIVGDIVMMDEDCAVVRCGGTAWVARYTDLRPFNDEMWVKP